MKIAVAQLLCHLYDVMAASSQFFSDATLKDFRETGQSLVLLYSELHAEAFGLHQKLWKFPPKAHLVDHLVTYQAAEWGNPSYYWCYADEDLVGLCIEIAESCHPSTLAITALVKWLILAFDVDAA